MSARVPDPARVLWGQIGAFESWRNTQDRAARTQPARDAFNRRSEKFADPAAARRAYYLRLAAKSAEARRRKKAS